MQLIWIFLLFHAINVLCFRENDNARSLRIALYNTFSYNFKMVPKIGKVIFWKISKDQQVFQPQQYVKNVTQFESHETYLIFTKTHELNVSIYYWLGINTLLDDKKAAAKYAIFQYTFFMEYMESRINWVGEVSLSREVETMESASFHITVNYGVRQDYHTYLDSEYISQYPNLYVVRGDTTTRIKKIPMGTLWLISDTCLILETGYTIEEFTPVNMYCGPNASEKAKKRTNAFINFVYIAYIRVSPPKPLLILDSTNRNEPKFKQLIEVLEDMENYKSYEVDESNDHLKDATAFVADRDIAVKLFWIEHRTVNVEATNEKKRIIEKREDKTRPISSELLTYERGRDIGFLFDSTSIAGLIVYMDSECDFNLRKAIMDVVEDYIEEKYSSCSIPPRVRIIRESRQNSLIIDLLLNINTWPVRNDGPEAVGMGYW